MFLKKSEVQTVFDRINGFSTAKTLQKHKNYQPIFGLFFAGLETFLMIYENFV
jgi:hypothetical protein